MGFGANISESSDIVEIQITTASGRQFYLASEEFWIRLDAGKITRLEYVPESQSLKVFLAPATAHQPVAYVRCNRDMGLSVDIFNEAYKIPLHDTEETAFEIYLKQ